MDFAAILVEHVIPGYRALTESYDNAQSVQKVGRETKLDRLEAAQAETKRGTSLIRVNQ